MPGRILRHHGPAHEGPYFGGFEFSEADLDGDWVATGYEMGVPMGGDLSGGGELTPILTNPGFDPTLKAVYYLRVLEIPTPRWTAPPPY